MKVQVNFPYYRESKVGALRFNRQFLHKAVIKVSHKHKQKVNSINKRIKLFRVER